MLLAQLLHYHFAHPFHASRATFKNQVTVILPLCSFQVTPHPRARRFFHAKSQPQLTDIQSLV